MKNLKVSNKSIKEAKNLIDIRTEDEWRETGILPNSFCLTFVDENGELNSNFVEILEKNFDKNEPINLICHSGNRSKWACEILDRVGFETINLDGGIGRAIMLGIHLVPKDFCEFR